jgi:hypothetical protein
MSSTKARMPEGEVSLLFAMHLLRSGCASTEVSVAIDGSQVRTGKTLHFDPKAFMNLHGWESSSSATSWQGKYTSTTQGGCISIHTQPGIGDVAATLRNGQKLVAEAKKGPLERSKSSQEYPLLREALGQLLTISEIPSNPVLLVLVPHTPKFAELAARWREAPLVMRAGIGICTVALDGSVSGWSYAREPAIQTYSRRHATDCG